MLQIFKKLDNYTFLLSKYRWDEEDEFTSTCINLEKIDETSYKGDVRIIWPEALSKYLKLVFPELHAADRSGYLAAVNLQLQGMYKAVKSDFNKEFLSKIDYDRPLFKHQKNAIQLLVQHRCNLLSFDMGLGKAMKFDAKILTPNGWTTIDKLSVGDLIYGSNGSTTVVTGVFPQGGKNIFRVEFTDGSTAECCDEHLWSVQSANHKKRGEGFRTLSLKEIMSDLSYANGNLKHYIPMVNTVFFDEKPVPINPYILGVLLGDGSFRNKHISLSTPDEEIVKYFEFFLPNDLRIVKRQGDGVEYGIVGDGLSNSYIQEIKKLGLMEKYSNEKFVPDIYKYNHSYVRLQILRGLLDTDGYISKSDGTIQYYSTSEQMTNDVIELVQSFGGIARKKQKRGSYKKNGVKINCQICYTITINLPKEIIPFKLTRRLELMKEVKKYNPTRGIKKIIPIGHHEAICISVDAPDKLFVTGDYVLTHNTITSATISKIMDYQRTVIIAPSGVKWNWFHDMCDEWGFDPINWTILDARKSRCQYAFMEKFVVVNFENIEKHGEYLASKKVDHFIIDEVHLCKNSTTQRFKAVKALLDKFPNARITLLTGTPITNRLDDMVAYYKLLDHPLGKNKSYFSDRYLRRSNGKTGKIIGAQNVKELRVRHWNMMIRKKAEECLDLPPLIINKCYLDEDKMSKEYHELLKEMYQHRAEQMQEGKSIRQMEGEVSGNIHSLNRILATCKVADVIELIDKLWLEGRKAVVFSGYTAPLDMLKEHYAEKSVKIDGSVDSYNRSLMVERFTKEKNCHVFLGNVQAAGVGINLVNSCDVIMMNFPFTPDRIEQPYKRTHRIGQKQTVNVYMMFVKNSIDQNIYSIVVDKSKDINDLLDKNRKGTINYESGVMNLVFNQVISQYAEDHGLPKLKTEFQEV